jgi:hypothetical protein
MDDDLINEKSLPRKYIQFPLFLLHDIVNNKDESITNILRYGIYHFAMAIETNLVDVAKQICYNNYRRELNQEISNLLNKYQFEYFGLDEDYNGFSGENFNPEDEINELLNLFDSDHELKNNCIEFNNVNQALKLLNLKGDADAVISHAKFIKRQIKPKEIMPMIGIHLLFDYRDTNKSEFDIIQLKAYIAIQSILGVKLYAKTNKQFILQRMFGVNQNIELLNKYDKRHHWEKLMLQLQMNWNLNVYSNRTRGVWVSIGKKNSLLKLIEHAENIKAKNSIENFKKLKQEIINTTIKGTTSQQ